MDYAETQLPTAAAYLGGRATRDYVSQTTEPAERVVESIASALDRLEGSLGVALYRVEELSGRLFEGPRDTAAGRGEAPREPSTIPAIHNRLDRLAKLSEALSEAVARLERL